MRIQLALAIVGLTAALAAPASGQTIKKVGDQTHHVLKKTGNGIKKGAKHVGSTTHNALTKAGNATKTAAGDVTGVHKIGGSVGKAAQGVSHKGKNLSRKAKHGLKKSKADAHADLTQTGKDTKAAVKKP
ncbi:MAG TPA: hypothetical protein VK636_08505 [Gemmatimonadaceae bacterium]|nr:hypothetical protein [Gemmatimonadaceae bacterium]